MRVRARARVCSRPRIGPPRRQVACPHLSPGGSFSLTSKSKDVQGARAHTPSIAMHAPQHQRLEPGPRHAHPNPYLTFILIFTACADLLP
eukprot:6189069-Pleurochrysis_carterae.AAC.1